MARLRHFGKAMPVVCHLNWIAALVTLFATYLHVLFFVNAGGLWRGEAGLVYLSLLPSFSEVWQNLPHNSCPILMPLVVRAWSAAGFGNTDPGLRVFRAPSWRWNQLDDELRRTDKGSVGKGIDLKEGATHSSLVRLQNLPHAQ